LRKSNIAKALEWTYGKVIDGIPGSESKRSFKPGGIISVEEFLEMV